jgi:hypothetical protein
MLAVPGAVVLRPGAGRARPQPHARRTASGVAVLATVVGLLLCRPLWQVLGADGVGNLRRCWFAANVRDELGTSPLNADILAVGWGREASTGCLGAETPSRRVCQRRRPWSGDKGVSAAAGCRSREARGEAEIGVGRPGNRAEQGRETGDAGSCPSRRRVSTVGAANPLPILRLPTRDAYRNVSGDTRVPHLVRVQGVLAATQYKFSAIRHRNASVAERPDSPAAAARAASTREKPTCRRGQVQRRVQRYHPDLSPFQPRLLCPHETHLRRGRPGQGRRYTVPGGARRNT